jgi:hypothetical protein
MVYFEYTRLPSSPSKTLLNWQQRTVLVINAKNEEKSRENNNKIKFLKTDG